MEDGRWKMEDGRWEMGKVNPPSLAVPGREPLGQAFLIHPPSSETNHE